MTDVTNRLPFPISERFASTAAQITQRHGRAIDYALAGVPFLSAASRDLPAVELTAEMKKDQFDNEQEPGEQSLSGWWLRSQDSWHQGAGARFQEPRGELAASARFWESSGVDVWTENELKLLRRMVQSSAAGSAATSVAILDDTLYFTEGATVKKTVVGSGSVTTLDTQPGKDFIDIVVGQAQWYAITQQGDVFMGPISGAATKTFPLTNPDAPITAPPSLIWAKHRLIAVYGRRAYVVDTTQPTTTAMASLYNHPAIDWIYTGIAEGPQAIYLAGYSNAESAVQRLTIDPGSGDIPTLTAGVTTAVMPPGERVERIATLAGSFIAIATQRGMRIGALNADGDIVYGALFLRPEGVTQAKGLVAWDRFFYASWDAGPVYRIDVSQEVAEGEFAWATDADTDLSGYFVDLAILGEGRVVAAFSSGNYLYQHDTELVESGTIEMGKIRFRTTERKLFKWLGLEIEPLAGSIVLDAITETGTTSRIDTYSVQGNVISEQSEIPTTLGPMRSMGLVFTLNRGTDPTEGPLIHSYTLKALPSVKPQILIQLPLMCFDSEQWSTGQRDGYDGWAAERLAALRQLEAIGDVILLQDFSEEESTGRQVKIDEIRFAQTGAPSLVRKAAGRGGILQVLLRTVD